MIAFIIIVHFTLMSGGAGEIHTRRVVHSLAECEQAIPAAEAHVRLIIEKQGDMVRDMRSRCEPDGEPL